MFSANKYKSQPLLYVYDSYEQNGFFCLNNLITVAAKCDIDKMTKYVRRTL